MRKDSIQSIRNDKRFRIAFLIIFMIIVALIAFIFRYFFWPLLFALVCYVALKPVHDIMHRYIKTRWICSLTIITLFMLVIIIPFFFLLYALADQTFQFYQLIAQKVVSSDIQRLIYSDNRAVAIMKAFKITRVEMLQKVMEFLQNTSLLFFANLSRMASFSLRFLVNFLFMLMIMFAIFNEGQKLGNLVYHIIPFPRDIEHSILKRLREVIKVLVAGNIAIMLLQGAAMAVGFFIFGIKVPVLGGCLGALFSLIPGVGTSLVWIPAVVGYLLTGKYLAAALLAVWCLGWYFFLENIAKPRFFGSKLNFHPLVFFFLLIGSIGAFGLPGIIVGPIILTLFFSLWEIYSILYVEIPVRNDLHSPVKRHNHGEESEEK